MSTYPLVYLAGPIAGLNYSGATEWRQKAKDFLAEHQIIGISPMRAKEYLATVEKFKEVGYDEHPLSCNKGITTRDRFDCTRADVVLVNLLGASKISIGTVMEIAWADSARIPIVLAMESDNPHTHGMLTEVAGYIVPSLSEALDIVVAILKI